MKFAVLGDRGLVGTAMTRFLQEQGVSFKGFNRENLDLHRETDLSLGRKFSDFDAVINCVGYTAVDKAESEVESAFFVNGTLPGLFAKACGISGSRLAHISTDYVFDGERTIPYEVTDETNPTSVYGASKAIGELNVLTSGASATIFRSAWLYDQHENCFPTKIAKKLSRGEPIRVVDDQWGQPTWAKDLVSQIFRFMSTDSPPTIVHAVASGKANWYQFASEVSTSLDINPLEFLTPVSSSEFSTQAKRPAWSVLDNSSDVVEPIGDWRQRWLVAADEVLGSR